MTLSTFLTNHIKRSALVLIFVGGAVARADEGPFVSLSFDDACARAEKDHKAVFLVFYTTWCHPCKILDQQTWKDKRVVTWLKEKTVALKLDAEAHDALARRYRIDGYPTLLFLKPDGTEMDRIGGFAGPKEFLIEAEAILSGKDALTRAKMRLEAAGANNLTAKMMYARTLIDLGKDEEALEALLWCYDEGLKRRHFSIGVRLSFLLSDIEDLSRRYPPARQALQVRSDAARDQILAGTGTPLQVMEFDALNDHLGQPQATLALYDKLKSEHPDWEIIADLRREAFDQLREKRRYAEIYRDMNIAQSADKAFARSQPGLVARLWQSVTFSKQQRESLEQARGRMLFREIGSYYEVLIGAEQLEEAGQLADRLLKVDSSAVAYNCLAWHGYLTGRPTEANLEQARQAYDLTEGHNAAIVDTFARVLHARGETAQAHEILRQALQQIHDARERELLQACLADLGGTASQDMTWMLGLAGLCVVILAFGVILLMARRSKPQSEPGEPSG